MASSTGAEKQDVLLTAFAHPSEEGITGSSPPLGNPDPQEQLPCAEAQDFALPESGVKVQDPKPQESAIASSIITSPRRANCSESRANDHSAFPEGSLRAWLVIAGSFSIICGTFGLLSSVGLFQAYWQMNQLRAYTARDIGWITAVNVFFNFFLGVQIGPLFDRFGPRWLILGGSVTYVASLLALAQCTRYWHFMVTYGIVGGASSAFLTTTSLSVVAHWFDLRRGFASGIVFVGSSVGGIVFPLVLKSAFEHMSWDWSLRLVALIAFVLMVLGNICIKGRLPPKQNGGTVNLRCFIDARFSWTTVGVACFEFTLFGALGLLPLYILERGFSSETTFNAIAIMNAGSAVGRTMAGLLSDKIGRFNVMILTLSFSIVVTLAVWLPVGFGHQVVLIYFFAVLFGFGSGSIISMAPVCLGQLCKADEYGQYYGTSYSVVAFASLVSIPIGGALLPNISAVAFVSFFGGVLVLSLGCFLMARWACLDYRWRWKVIV